MSSLFKIESDLIAADTNVATPPSVEFTSAATRKTMRLVEPGLFRKHRPCQFMEFS